MRSTLFAFVAAAAMLLSACGGGAPTSESLDAEVFRDHAGCGNVYLYATASDGPDEVVLSVSWDGLLNYGEGEHATSAVTDDTVHVGIEFGRFISNLPCNDVIEREPIVTGTGSAVEGEIVATVRPHEEQGEGFEQMGFVDLTVTDLVFENADGDRLTIEGDVVFTNVFVGWLAG